MVATLLLFCQKRAKKRIRVFSLRAITPLDDAEFESWRRPSTYTQKPEKYGIMPSRPPVVRAKNSASIFEKDIQLFDKPHTPPRTSVKSISPSSPIRMPDHARRKSSVTSLQDRPPTPYSPGLSEDDEHPAPWLPRRDSQRSRGHVHYPSMSEASEFDFGFNSAPRHNERSSEQSERQQLYIRTRQDSQT